MSDLEDRLLAAHAAGDAAVLSRLYTEAADDKERQGDLDAACFYLTHAYVFALDAGLPTAGVLNKRLVEYGRDIEQGDLSP